MALRKPQYVMTEGMGRGYTLHFQQFECYNWIDPKFDYSQNKFIWDEVFQARNFHLASSIN